MADPERGQPGTWQYLAFWKDGAISPGATLAHLPCNDLDAARLLAGEYEGMIHFTHGPGEWHVWDGRCHALDVSGWVPRLVILLADRMEWALAAARGAVERRERLNAGLEQEGAATAALIRKAMEPFEPAVKYAAGLRRTAGWTALVRTLAAICSVDAAVFDEKEPRWLNCANGTIDLSSGELRPHNPQDMLSYCTEQPLDYGAQCPQFISLVRRVCGGDEEVAWYLIRVLGYALLGHNPEQLIFFIDGPTKSGKSVLLEIVSSVLGPLAHESQAALITVVRHGRNARTENSIRGKRLVTITETSAFMTIDEGQLKRITGEASVSVDQHYAKTEIKTPVTWTIISCTNRMPVLTDFDDAMRERIIVIPGGPTIPAELRDKHLARRILAQEAAGILALLVRSCAEYSRHGLGRVPLAVEMKTSEYAAVQNTVANFLADCTFSVAGWSPEGVPLAVGQHEAWDQYQRWAKGTQRLGRNEFYQHMAAQPGVRRNEAMRRFEGISWKPGIFGTGTAERGDTHKTWEGQ